MRLALNFFRVDPSRGGAETYVADLARRLVRAGHRVDLYANSWDEAALAGVGCRYVEARGPSRGRRLWDFAANSEAALRRESHDCTIGFINTWHHDVIIPQGGVHGASLACNARRFPAGWRRSAYLVAKWANPRAWLYRAIERKQYDPARGARVVAVSGMVRGHLERYHGVPRDRIRVIPNAIDTGRLEVPDPGRARRALRAGLGLGEDDLVGLFVGHNAWLKGLKPLLIALAHRLRRDPRARPIHLIACGGGRQAPFQALADRLGLSETVHLVGFLPDVAAGYRASDFFALPSYYDPCSLVVLEALTCGLPVITSASNGAGELLTPGREGFVINSPDEIAHLADCLDRMADDPTRQTMSEHAARLGRAQSLDAHVERLLELFEEVAREKTGIHQNGAKKARELHLTS